MVGSRESVHEVRRLLVESGPFRQFTPAPTLEEEHTSDDVQKHEHRIELQGAAFRVSHILKYAFVLAAFPIEGPAEKVAWWCPFSFRGIDCLVANEKFGLRLYAFTKERNQHPNDIFSELQAKLIAAVGIAEKWLLTQVPMALNIGDVTVVNQHHELWASYRYFAKRAMNPDFIPDRRSVFPSPLGGGPAMRFTSGQAQMRRNAHRDLVAAVNAFLSSLEHRMVLALPFIGFEPEREGVTDFIGSRWGVKFERVFGDRPDGATLRLELRDVVENWRNPYSHGGFEKGYGATLFVHVQGVGAVPVGMTDAGKSPLFTLRPASEVEIAAVIDFLDGLDRWIGRTIPEATRWAAAGLDVRFDEEFQQEVNEMIQCGRFDDLLIRSQDEADRYANMDF